MNAILLVLLVPLALGGAPKPLPPQSRFVTICETGAGQVSADAYGIAPASAAIQRCLDGAPMPWPIPAGNYRLDAALTINRPLELIAHGVTFKADRNLTGNGGAHTMIFAGYIAGVTIKGLTIDGNLQARQGAAYCDGTNSAYQGGNIHFDHVDDVVLEGVTTRNAVCGSGMHFSGKRARIVGSTFERNGQHVAYRWADGLTLLNCDDCVVTGNTFADNTDVGLVFGGGRNTTIANNTFRQSVPVFAALALDNFNDSQSGDFTGMTISGNTINCGQLLCDFGINVGPHAWYLSSNTKGGTVTGNTVTGAKIGVLAGGAGTAAVPATIFGNAISGSPVCGTPTQFSCGVRIGCPAIYSPDSFIDAHGEEVLRAFHRSCP